ncbi:MAG: PrsW family intramembrane metalloprotease [Oscillospiraceae bacterium]|nr:PrsW family intramembrane metalloprotease [Oscillospiraceae bacterium]
MDILLAFLASSVPALIVYLILKKRNPGKPGYADDCKKAFLNGIKSTLFVVPSALILNILCSLTGLMDINVFVEQFIKDFIFAALLEEVFKIRAFLKVLEESECEYSWLDVTAYMILSGLGFETLESIVYAFTSGAGQVIVRGLTMMHGMFGLITGYFWGKALYTGEKKYKVLAFLIPYIYHGLYDFTLSKELSEYGDFFLFTPVLLAFFSVVLIIVMIVFFRKNRETEKYNVSLRPHIEGDPVSEEVPDLPEQTDSDGNEVT